MNARRPAPEPRGDRVPHRHRAGGPIWPCACRSGARWGGIGAPNGFVSTQGSWTALHWLVAALRAKRWWLCVPAIRREQIASARVYQSQCARFGALSDEAASSRSAAKERARCLWSVGFPCETPVNNKTQAGLNKGTPGQGFVRQPWAGGTERPPPVREPKRWALRCGSCCGSVRRPDLRSRTVHRAARQWFCTRGFRPAAQCGSRAACSV